MLFWKKYLVFINLLLLTNIIVAQQPELILPSSNSNKLEAMAISRDEKFCASADLDGSIKIWENASGKLLKTLHRQDIYDIMFTPDNRSLIITSFTPTEVYNLHTGASTFLGNFQYTHGLDISADGKWIATVSDGTFNNGLACIWDAKTFQLKDSFRVGVANDNVKFSNSGRQAAFYGNKTIELWTVDKPALLKKMEGHSRQVKFLLFDKKDGQLISVSNDSTAILWNAKNGKQLQVFRGHQETVWEAAFHPAGKKIITVSSDKTARIWNSYSGKLLKTISAENWIYKVQISGDEKQYILTDAGGNCSVWDTVTDTLLYTFKAGDETLYYANFLKNGHELLAGNYDPMLSRWDMLSGKKIMTYGLFNDRITSLALSNNEKYLVTTTRGGHATKIDVTTGKVIFWVSPFTLSDDWATSAAFHPNDSLIAVSGGYESTVLFNQDGDLEGYADDKTDTYESGSVFSPDGKYLLHTDNSTAQLTRMTDNKRVLTVDSITSFSPQRFSPDGNYLITGGNNFIKIWSVSTQQLLIRVSTEAMFPSNIAVSPDSKYFLCVDPHDNILEVWEMYSGRPVKVIEGVNDAFFSSDTKNLKIIYTNGKVATTTITGNEPAIVVTTLVDSTDVNRGNYYTTQEDIMVSINRDEVLVRSLVTGHTLGKTRGNEVALAKSGKYLYVAGDDVIEVYGLRPFRLLYKYYIINSDDHLVVDDKGRYDGKEASRKLLYFTCGTEVIELDQAKDLLWVPGLAERIIKGDSINAKSIDELNICGLTPEVEDKSSADQYRFDIKPRRGGLGETVLYINGIEARRYKLSQLTQTANGYQLQVAKKELSIYFIAGKENPVTIKAYTADNTISSRGIIINEDKTAKKETAGPNLYAVIVGVSDYKGEKLDLKYAAKDANDIANAVSISAKKLLNTDEKEHVFVYDLTTNEKRFRLPEKNSIKKVLEEIGAKATANDILLIFFAGHGVMSGEQKKFYFLTADASDVTGTESVADVGISTAELTEWMKPQNIKAQKRILIFDACNSGQAILDLVKVGNDGQGYIAARSDEQSQQIKAIDKLNEQSGFFILSASASNQSAYEMGRYSQGLLTYSLLRAIKQQPDILEQGKYLDVSRWFSAAEKTVTELTKETGARQQPQVISNTNFNIGIVDEEVMAKISLQQEKPLFTNSNLQNADENIAYDDKELSKLLDAILSDISARGSDGPIVYTPNLKTGDVWVLSGRYEIKGNSIVARINIRQGNAAPKHRFELTGTTDKLNELATAIAEKATSLVK